MHSAAHALRHLGDLLAINGHGAAVYRSGPVVVKGAVRGYVDGAAVNVDVTVGVDRVGVALAHGDGRVAAVELDHDIARRALLSGIDAIVGRADLDGPVVDLNVSPLDSFHGGDVKAAARDLRHGRTLDAVVARLDRMCSSGYVHRSDCVVILVLTVDAVLARLDCERSVGYCYGIVGLHGVLRAGDIVSSARDRKLILGGYAISICGIDGQGPLAVQGQVGLREDRRVQIRVTIGGVLACDGEGIAAAVRRRYKDLVRIHNVNGRLIAVFDRHAVQHQLDLGLRSIDRDRDILCGSADQIDALLRDRNILAVRQLDLLRR